MECVIIKPLSEQLKEKVSQNDSNIYYKNKSVFVKLGDNIIGFYTVCKLLNKLTLEYNLFEEYRNKGLGVSFVQYVTDVVSKQYPEYNEVYLLIDYNNIPSIKVASYSGYSESDNYDLKEIISNEMKNVILYSKQNEYYQKSEISKQLLHKL